MGLGCDWDGEFICTARHDMWHVVGTMIVIKIEIEIEMVWN